ncbi:hypothetical protein Kpol_1059p17 [Vanderwaltozyma polyspora DSM 70294]|uniref:NAD(+) kinase n=1 Tax=Vanderwaltozyma polyspora (strain ATCC 22028 / DSM 70294 / BCRC 21397 / CBS 2163 / NBRC 10782 / NRRL Y-8283 / UCD 57-17) TaxID=436907 RepID=A7TN21_VANPO|nr:uncharacterized protein Kpol_1059p17 [Vanderwaltozyma polyspora DSM 70294]EDO16327.1 hypothetical protein Kpol_1059p17 [Vanderwaltozyma polyspora DSM 70294]
MKRSLELIKKDGDVVSPDLKLARTKPDTSDIKLKWKLYDEPKSTDIIESKTKKITDGYDGCIEVSRRDSKSTSKSMPNVSEMKASFKPHFKYASHAYGLRMMSKKIFNTRVELDVENLMIVIKQNEVSLIYLMRELVEWLLINFPSITIYLDEALKGSKTFDAEDICTDSKCSAKRISYWNQEFLDNNVGFFDLVMTLGGDGTVLYVSSIFQKHTPPIVSFALGSLGFLTNFKFEHFRKDLPLILNNKIKTNLRMRLECKVFRRRDPVVNPETGKKIFVSELISEHHVLNELTVDRGSSPFISMLELYGDSSLFTVAQADGLIVSTPTGSTAYSLSAGGSLVYPSVNAIAVTPICPHTLSFRPIILPDSMNLKVRVSLKSRATAWAAFDGKNKVELQPGDYISIAASPYAFPTVESSSSEFIDSIGRTLNWNVREEQKSFTHMLSQKNKEKFAIESYKMDDSDSSVEELEVNEKIGDEKLDMDKIESLLDQADIKEKVHFSD